MGRGNRDDVWIGLDVGTQGARALVVAGGGRILGRGSRPLAGRRRGPLHEQDPGAWWEAAAGACREALEHLAPARVGGIATDSTSGTVLLVDRAGAPLTAGLMYDDSRAADQAERANEVCGEVWGRLGYRMRPGWGLPKLLWLLEHQPGRAAGARLAHQCDHVNRRLVGRPVATDSSHALKSGFDLIEDRWPAALARLGVPPEALPAVVGPGSLLGEVCEEAARESAIPAGTPVIAGMTDGCAAQIAARALAEGDWSSTLGTTLTLKGASARLVRDPNGVLYCHRSPDGGWLPGGASSAGAAALDESFAGRDLEQLAARAGAHEQTDVLAYPLAGRGERFPFAAPDAEGFVLGRPANDAEHFAALLFGLAFLERLCFDYVDLLGADTGGEVSLTGGATRGRYLSRLRADVLGRPLRLLESADPAMGMAVLAAAGDRAVADVAAEMVKVSEVIEPREGRTGPFLERYGRLLEELERRGWLGTDLADHARSRAGAGR